MLPTIWIPCVWLIAGMRQPTALEAAAISRVVAELQLSSGRPTGPWSEVAEFPVCVESIQMLTKDVAIVIAQRRFMGSTIFGERNYRVLVKRLNKRWTAVSVINVPSYHRVSP